MYNLLRKKETQRLIYPPGAISYLALTVCLGCVRTTLDDNVRRVLGLIVEVVVKDCLDTSSVSGLGIKSSTGHMRNHCVTASLSLVLHCTPWVVLWSGLREPHITTVTTELSGSKRISDIYDQRVTN